MKLCYYIDEWNLPADCKLKLVVQEDSERQEAYKYRLKPAEVYGPQVFNISINLTEDS